MSETKVCTKCKRELPLTEEYFYKNNRHKNGFDSSCKECVKAMHKLYNGKHASERKQYHKKYYEDNKEKILNNQRQYYEDHKQKYNEWSKKHYQSHKEQIAEKHKQYYQLHKKEIAEKSAEWKKSHKQKIYESTYKNHRARMKTDPIFKLKKQARSMIWNSFNRTCHTKPSRSEFILGCSANDFSDYLLKTFFNIYAEEWDGIEPVHIDHIIPLSTAETEDDVMKLCHYTNLQLLKAADNLAKSNKLNYAI